MVSLAPGQGVTIPAGVMHLPHARGRTVVLMVEKAGVVPTGTRPRTPVRPSTTVPQHLALQAPPVEGRVLRLRDQLVGVDQQRRVEVAEHRSAGAPLARRPCGRPSRSAGAEVTVRIRSISGMRPSWWKSAAPAAGSAGRWRRARPRPWASACPRPAPGRGRHNHLDQPEATASITAWPVVPRRAGRVDLCRRSGSRRCRSR